ncbi:MAG: hypothetical protein MZW92_54895 [Comamonadaceae bacterium]|nr:hypothetical protein [Comamonadaceae bacterium]
MAGRRRRREALHRGALRMTERRPRLAAAAVAWTRRWRGWSAGAARAPHRRDRDRSPPSTPWAACWPPTCESRWTCRRQDNTSMDGYALRAAGRAGRRHACCRWRSASPPASWASRWQPGTAARIFTGAPGAAGRRRGRDAGAVRGAAGGDGLGRCASTRCRSPASGSAARGEDVRSGAAVLAARHAPDAAGAGPGGLGRRGHAARSCAARAWRCSPPATNW